MFGTSMLHHPVSPTAHHTTALGAVTREHSETQLKTKLLKTAHASHKGQFPAHHESTLLLWYRTRERMLLQHTSHAERHNIRV